MMDVLSVDDLGDDDVDWVLDRARQHKAARMSASALDGAVIGLAFFEASLRTRTGFAAAAARLGAHAIEVNALRSSDVSMPESTADTLRVLGGYCDVVVVRALEPLAIPRGAKVPFINGCDRGPVAEPPAQAMIGLFARDQFLGGRDRLCDLKVAICGDTGMRAARSLLKLLARRPPARLILVTAPPIEGRYVVPDAIAPVTEYRSLGDSVDVDVLYVVGMHHAAITGDAREQLVVTREHLDLLPSEAIVLSPLPLIDEMTADAVQHKKVRMFEQSDNGLFVRMALLEFVLSKA